MLDQPVEAVISRLISAMPLPHPPPELPHRAIGDACRVSTNSSADRGTPTHEFRIELRERRPGAPAPASGPGLVAAGGLLFIDSRW